MYNIYFCVDILREKLEDVVLMEVRSVKMKWSYYELVKCLFVVIVKIFKFYVKMVMVVLVLLNFCVMVKIIY